MTTDNRSAITPLNCDRDAERWAREFNEMLASKGVQPIDPGTLIGWFANAMMCGEDTYRWRQEAKSSSTTSAVDPDRAEFLAEAQAKLSEVLEKGSIEAVRWMIQTAADYHASQAAGADAIGESFLQGCVDYHDEREKELLALLAKPSTFGAMKALRSLVDAVEGTADMDEADGAEFHEAQAALDRAVSEAKAAMEANPSASGSREEKPHG